MRAAPFWCLVDFLSAILMLIDCHKRIEMVLREILWLYAGTWSLSIYSMAFELSRLCKCTLYIVYYWGLLVLSQDIEDLIGWLLFSLILKWAMKESNPKNIIFFSSRKYIFPIQSFTTQYHWRHSDCYGRHFNATANKNKFYQQEIVFVLFNLLFNSVSLCSSLCWVGMASQSQVCWYQTLQRMMIGASAISKTKMLVHSTASWLPNQMISLVLIFGFLCQSSIFRYPDDLRNIVQQCATPLHPLIFFKVVQEFFVKTNQS